MNKIGQSIKETVKQECEYRQDIDNLAKDLETKVIFLKLASMLKPEVDVILHAKEETKSQRANILSDEQIERFTRNLVQLIEERYTTSKNIDTLALINELKRQQEEGDDIEDKYDFLTHEEVMQLDKLVNSAIVNPLAELDEKRSRLNKEIQEMPRQQQQLKEYQQALNGSDYTIIELYEANSKNIQQLKDDIENKDYDSVITKSRTLLEEVLIFIIEKLTFERYRSSGDLVKIYQDATELLNMRQNSDWDKRVNELLGGLHKLVSAISSMRNMNSDAHGVGKARINIKEKEARLVMNAAITYCEYMLIGD
jgi:hypothetical protein